MIGVTRPKNGKLCGCRLGLQLTRYLAVYVALWKNSLTREMMFKTNFVLWIIVELLWFGLQLAFVGVLYMHTSQIGTWTKWEVVLLVGVAHFIQQTFQGFCLINCANLSDLVRTGKLDFLLLLPINSRFLISLRQVDPGAFVNAGSAVAVIVYAAHKLDLHISLWHLLAFLVLCVIGIMIHYALMFVLAAASFWITRAEGLVWTYYNMFQLARMPDEAFRGPMKLGFTFLIPMLLVANVPARVLAQKLTSPTPLLLMFASAVLCFAFSSLIWKAALKRYTSASS